ncbi:non-ribosomal peptide synthetase [Puia dinghuensis]|uniref:Carrier domain-containing protein n=1 Tax=Puia dinghuensis TaxID=1792502 RepID=A0A8J2U5V4_9BACT|nr:non-ribosomal peptide synthetase [Puia dinghuensis]GGA81080.1 hypothetical protein GCM10011511_00060 [Puia dinghuensis]
MELDTLTQVLYRARQYGDKSAYIFLNREGTQETALTYSQLITVAGDLAASLLEIGQKGDRVLLAFPPGLDFISSFYAVVMAGMIAIPAHFPQNQGSSDRIRLNIEHCQVSIVLTLSSRVGKLSTLTTARIKILAVDNLDKHHTSAPILPGGSPQDPVLIQFTSGSTNASKGVTITHSNILHNQSLIKNAFAQDSESVIVGWLPFYHDMGLIGNIIHTLYLGATAVLFSPVDFLMKPRLWLEAISKYKGTISGAPNFAFQLCVDRIAEKDLATLDLSTWNSAYCGAEIVNSVTLDKFIAKFSKAGFNAAAIQPCYGMAEATLLISAGRHGQVHQTRNRTLSSLQYGTDYGADPVETKIDIVNCGKPYGFEVKLINVRGCECSDGEVGEICIRGNSVSSGYWNHAVSSQEDFMKFIDGEGPYFSTGDLGFKEEEDLFITGRKKEMIILRGTNYYPTDIERVVTSAHEDLVNHRCAAFSVNTGDAEDLIIVAEIEYKEEKNVIADILNRIRHELSSQYEISAREIVLIRKNSLPRTTSGKIQRAKCRDQYINHLLKRISHSVVDPDACKLRNSNYTPEEMIIKNAAEGLTRNTIENKHTSLFSLGLDSITGSRLTLCLCEEFNKEIPLDLIFSYPDITSLAKAIAELPQYRGGDGNKPGKNNEYFPLSPVQTGIWYDHFLKQNSSYNIPSLTSLKEEDDYQHLDSHLNRLISKHDILRTIFPATEDGPVQKVLPECRYEIGKFDLTGLLEQEIASRLRSEVNFAFQVDRWPLFKIALITLPGNKLKLLTIFHHLIADGQSILTFIKEMLGREELPPQDSPHPTVIPHHSYQEYVSWFHGYMKTPSFTDARNYWMSQLADARDFELPLRDKREVVAKEGYTVSLTFSKEEYWNINALAKKTRSTVYGVLLAAMVYLLSRISGRKQIIIGVPVNGRIMPSFQNMLGVFINVIMLKSEIDDTCSAGELVKNIQETLNQGLKHQLYPLNNVLTDLKAATDSADRSLTKVFFNGLNFFTEPASWEFYEAFQTNLGVDPNQDINCYAFQNEDEIRLRIDCNPRKVDLNEANRLVFQYRMIMNNMLQQPDTPLEECMPELPLPQEEYRQIIAFSNGVKVPIPAKSLLTRIGEQVSRVPQNLAYCTHNGSITYETLWQASDSVAQMLVQRNIKRNDLVPVLIRRSIELPIAALGCLKAGAAYIPLDVEWPEERLSRLIDDLGSTVLLVDNSFDTAFLNKRPEDIIVMDVQNLAATPFATEYSSDPEALVYGFYTSGTTGMPKCALNRHIGILNRFLDMDRRYNGSEKDCILFTSRQSFDVSFWQMFWPLTNGAKVVIPKTQKGFDPVEFAEMIHQYQVTLIDLVPSVFNIFVEYLCEQSFSPEKLKTLRHVLIGGEVINAGYVHRFRKKFSHIEVANTYGPTEASMGTIFYRIDDQTPEPIPIGKPIDNVKTVLVSGNNSLTPLGSVGEICLGGICLGAGYHGLPEKTKEVFIDNPFPDIECDKLYKTGDLGYYLPDGNIQFVGRLDDQIKINGVRIELGEIESTLITIPGIHRAIITTLRKTEKTEICAYIVAGAEIQEEKVKLDLRQKLPTYMIPSYILKIKEVPINANGKVDKEKLPLPHPPETDENLDIPKNDTERKVAAMYGAILHRTPASIDVNSNFFAMGGNSLDATRLVHKLREILQVDVPLRDIFENPTVAGLARAILHRPLISGKKNTAGSSGHYDLSIGQKRLWILSQRENASMAFNVPALVEIRGDLDIDRLDATLRDLTTRHAVLRTVFEIIDEQPRQRIIPPEQLDIRLQVLDLRGEPTHAIEMTIKEKVNTPFDLEKAPPFNPILFHIGEHTFYLLLNMHHLITDAWSIGLLTRDLLTMYDRRTEMPYVIETGQEYQYNDQVLIRQQYRESPEYLKHRDYWVGKYSNGIPVLDFPVDYPKTKTKTYKGACIDVTLNTNLIKRIREFSSETAHTPFTFFTSVVSLLLYRYTGQTKIPLQIPVSGRDYPGSEEQSGFFVNPLVISVEFDDNRSFHHLLDIVRNEMINAFEHQKFEFQDLVQEIGIGKSSFGDASFDVSIIMEDLAEIDIGISLAQGLTIKRKKFSKDYVVSDLSFIIRNGSETANISIEYNNSLFRNDTMQRLLGHLVKMTQKVLEDPAATLREVPFLEHSETDELIDHFNDTSVPYPKDKSVIDLFCEQVENAPWRLAINRGRTTYSYRQLDTITRQIAVALEKKGEALGPIVPVIAKDPLSTIIGILSVLKSGRAYMPVDADFPPERISMMIEDSGSHLVLVEKDLTLPVPIPEAMEIITDPSTGETKGSGTKQRNPESLCYIMYTSGSTGRPKGIRGIDRNVVRLVKNSNLFPISPGDRLLQTSPMTFDPCVMEIWGALLNGGTLYLTEKSSILDPAALRHQLESNQITKLWLTTPIFSEMASLDPALFGNLQDLVVGGDILLADKVWAVRKACPSVRITNAYGPTENGVFSTCYKVGDQVLANIPIGKPISNSIVYILDDYLQPVPPGVRGTLYVGGDGLPKGYLDEQLTKERFIADPFKKGKRIYDTGDLGRWLADGNIEFLGRKDRQIKISGIRIEPGEIENLLNSYPGIRTSYILIDGQSINAYIVPEEKNCVENDIKEFLKRHLLPVMIPEYLIQLPSLPLTNNGKINTRALPKPEKKLNQVLAPTNKTQLKLISIWAEVLNIEASGIAVDADFYDLGGNSLIMGRVISRIKKDFSVQLTYTDLLSNKSISGISALLENKNVSKLNDAIPVLDRSGFRV